MSKPSLDCTVEITDPSGNRYRWGAGARDPRDIPLSLRFSTRPGKGFDSCSLTLSRRLDAEYPDLQIEHEVRIIGADGKILWEGFTQSAPRERTMDGDSISLQALGWMDDAAGQEFVELLIDRDLSQWGDLSRGLHARLLQSGNWAINNEPSQENGWLMHKLTRLAQATFPQHHSGAMYRAPAPIARIVVDLGAQTSMGSGWLASINTSPVEDLASGEEFANISLPATGPIVHTPTNSPSYAWMVMFYGATYTGDGNWSCATRPTVYGATGLPVYARPDGGPDGIYVSDAVKYLWQKYYPQVDVSGVEQTTYPIPHAVWRDPVDLPTASAELNKYHAWKFGVWEGKKLEFAPYDFTRADWQVRAGENGVEVQAAGDSSEAVYNGADVSWTDFAERPHFLSARDVPELRDDSAWIPANHWVGKRRHLKVNISWQCEQADAIAIAQVLLQGANRAKRPSVITVPYYIRNGAGDWRPVGEVRSGQTIAVTNLVGDEPRLITATDVSDHRLVVSTDDAIADVETYFERVGMQLQAAGVS